MKKLICISVLFLTGTFLFGQDINLSPATVTTLLCKKWKADYALIGGKQISVTDEKSLDYEFKKDKTVLVTGNSANDKATGNWTYDVAKKLIRLTVNGNNVNIISLKENELIIVPDVAFKQITPDKPVEIQFVYKNNTNNQ